MKAMIISRPVLLVLGCLFIGLSGCNKLLEVPKPPNEILIADAFKDSASATAALSGVYSGMLFNNRNFAWGGVTIYTGLSGDDLSYTSTNSDLLQLNLNALNISNLLLPQTWTEAYALLLKVNTVIEQLNNNPPLAASVRAKLLGEALFVRAFIDFHLVNLWGDGAALTTTADLGKNSMMPSTPSGVMYAQIISDLQQAAAGMSNTYPTINRSRPNAMAARALLSRVYLYNRQYQEALVMADSVIGSGLYTPLPPVSTTFAPTSTEIIWALQPSPNPPAYGVTGDGVAFVPSSPALPPAYNLTSQLLTAFEPGDMRKTSWTKTAVVATVPYTYPFKYKLGLLDGVLGKGTENYILMRAAELFLVRAEANCKLGNISQAIADVNTIRARAGLADLQGNLSPDACMAAIEQENRVEYFAEWGHRWFDLKRWPATDGSGNSLADQLLPSIKPSWQPFQKLYPISRNELTYDPFLKQNPGY